jgi:hypothetical protein
MTPQCGLAPGFVGIVGARLAAGFDHIRSIRLRVGALPQHPTGLLDYAFNWSPEGVVNEYLNDCEVIEESKHKWISSMEWIEQIYVNGIHLEAFTTSGGAPGSGRSTAATAARRNRQSEVERRVVDHLLHDKEGPRLAHPRQRDELLAVQAVEVGDVAHPDFQKVVEVTGDEMAIEHEGQFRNRSFERAEALGGRAIEDDPDHDERTAVDALRRDLGAHRPYVSAVEEPLRPAVTGRRAGIYFLRELGVRQPAITLQLFENPAVDPVEVIAHERISHILRLFVDF